MSELTAVVLENTTLYFAQRRPRELGDFSWTIDAKDSLKITTQEHWWRDTLGPLQESRSRTRPLGRIDDPKFDYRCFEKAFTLKKEMWHPDRPREMVTGYDIKKIVSDRVEFKDSRSDILLQAVDILTSFMRRILMGRIVDQSVASTLGRIMICRRREGLYQSVELLSLTSYSGSGFPVLSKMVKTMSLAGRPMIRR